MQKTVQYLYLYFTKDDSDLLAWANMIKRKQSRSKHLDSGYTCSRSSKGKTVHRCSPHSNTPRNRKKG